MTPPPVAPVVVADVLDDLPPRLRKRVDASLDRAAAWDVVVDGDTARAELDADTSLTWTLSGGVLASAGDLVCSCLLAPRCLHRGVAVAAAEIAEVGEAAAAEAAVVETVAETAVEVAEAREDEQAAAGALWEACATVLRSGAAGSGAVVRAELLRAVHVARVAGLHRASAGGLRIAAALAAARAGDSSFDREVLTAELVDLMLLCHDLRAGAATAELRGTARREYSPVGSLRLYGLCTEAVVATSGYSGVVTHLVDESGLLWTVPAIMPGGAERVQAAAGGAVAIGESGLTKRGLGRSGMLLAGGTGSPDRRLGAGKAVRAVVASGAEWDASPLAGLWAQSLDEQVARAFHADTRPSTHRPAGDDLLFLEGVVAGAAGGALRLSLGSTHVDLVGDQRTQENLRVLAGAGGLSLRVVGRLIPDRPGVVSALAVASPDLALPSELRHHVDLGLDQLQRSHVLGDGSRELPPRPEVGGGTPQPLRPLENVVHRVALGGRAVAAVSSASRDVAALSRVGLGVTAELLADLAGTSRDRERDVFGRVVRDAGDAFPVAWLRAGVHVREFTRATSRRAWLEAVGV